MTQILVQPPELRQTAEQLRSHAQKIDQALKEIDADIRSLRGHHFLGHRSDAVQAQYAPKRDALLNAKQMVIHFAEELTTAASVFEKADSEMGSVGKTEDVPEETQKKTRVYLVNGINYHSNPDDTPEQAAAKMQKLHDNLEKEYGDDVEVIIVEAHPYASNEKDGDIDWVGVEQVTNEYKTGGSTQSRLVQKWIQENLEDSEFVGDVILVGHSGGGAIVANISDEIDGMDGVNLKGMVVMGSPVSNFDHASKYADNIIDIREKGDHIGRSYIRSDERTTKGFDNWKGDAISDAFWDVRNRDDYKNVTTYKNLDILDREGVGNGDAHNSYWESNQVVDIIGSLATDENYDPRYSGGGVGGGRHGAW